MDWKCQPCSQAAFLQSMLPEPTADQPLAEIIEYNTPDDSYDLEADSNTALPSFNVPNAP